MKIHLSMLLRVWRPKTPVKLAISVVIGALLISGIIFSILEAEASILDGIWWSFVSMTTVGYGDIAPKTTEMRILAAFVIISGIAATAILTAHLASKLTLKTLEAKHAETPELDDDIEYISVALHTAADELDRLRKIVCRPEVEEVLRKLHEEKTHA